MKINPRWSSQLEGVWLWDEYPERWGPDCGIDLMIKFQQHIPLYRFPCGKFVELYIFYGDDIYLPLLLLQKKALQLELMAGFSFFNLYQKNIGFSDPITSNSDTSKCALRV